MKRLLLQLLAALALPTAVNATILNAKLYKVASRSAQLFMNLPSSANDLIDKEQKIYDRAMKDAKKRSCYYIQ